MAGCPKYPEVDGKRDDIVNHRLKPFLKGIVITPEPRFQYEEDCQFNAIAGGADMSFKRCQAYAGKKAVVRFDERDFAKSTRSHLRMNKDKTPRVEDSLEFFEQKGVLVSLNGIGERRPRRRLLGSSGGMPSKAQVTNLITLGVPMTGTFECCDYFTKLRKNEVYQSLKGLTKAEEKLHGVQGHMVLFCGYGLTPEELLYLPFINSWEDFCVDGEGRIDFQSITAFYTIDVDIYQPPERLLIAREEKIIKLKCYGLIRRVELDVASKLCSYMDLRFKRARDGTYRDVDLPQEVTPAALTNIILYLRSEIYSENEEHESFREKFLDAMDVETLFQVMLGAVHTNITQLGGLCASALKVVVERWSEEEIYKNIVYLKPDEWPVQKEVMQILVDEMEGKNVARKNKTLAGVLVRSGRRQKN